MASFKALIRLFNKFSQGKNEAVMDLLYQWLFGQLSLNGITLDLDFTVMTRYGAQESAARGYNPGKRGRASHPLLRAFVADTRHRLGGKHGSLLRTDSGFLDTLDSLALHYILARRQNQPLQRVLVNTDGRWVLQEAFPVPFLAFEGEVLKMLDVTSTYRIDDAQLALLDAD
jgi:hypothetical protein